MIYELGMFLITGLLYIGIGELLSLDKVMEKDIFKNRVIRMIGFILLFFITIELRGIMNASTEYTLVNIISSSGYFMCFIILIRWSNRIAKLGFRH